SSSCARSRRFYNNSLNNQASERNQSTAEPRELRPERHNRLFCNKIGIYTGDALVTREHQAQVPDFSSYMMSRCKGLLILETYTTKFGDDMERPDFLDIAKEVTGDPFYSMFHLSLKK
ncbi:hypothetical protein OS493_040262, partial [Desmophyllum pertusum]